MGATRSDALEHTEGGREHLRLSRIERTERETQLPVGNIAREVGVGGSRLQREPCKVPVGSQPAAPIRQPGKECYRKGWL